ncbi:hypothetical protein [Mycobacterium sp. TY815]|uniref:hypothetical protein n=1 Tax=Mycobacterium sp. TY815 TaxID=3050581 RepID=UPI0027404C75|nr:hypothetical protein [Mycobacterium sp. TY815]MDP7706836.1 hypothetical protein [Mycobacterium sp. TY815]
MTTANTDDCFAVVPRSLAAYFAAVGLLPGPQAVGDSGEPAPGTEPPGAGIQTSDRAAAASRVGVPAPQPLPTPHWPLWALTSLAAVVVVSGVCFVALLVAAVAGS